MKKDLSPYVPQRDKLGKNSKLTIRERITWTPKQQEFLNIAQNKDMRIMFVKGPAGTSKTLISVYSSLKMLNEGKVSDIVYVRSAVESSDSKLGYLPGDADEKLAFYNMPFLDKLDELLTKADIQTLQKEERVLMYPVNFIRGLSWNSRAIIFDEAQNSSRKEIITVSTRLGQYNRLFVLADPLQTDLPHNKAGGFEEIFNLVKENEAASNDKGIYTFEFSEEDIVRSDLVRYLVSLYNKLKPINSNNH
jgi:phosphate starvation-inducible PhoH-like protein